MTTAERTSEDSTAAPAVGIPLDRAVRPLVERLREDAALAQHCYGFHNELLIEAATEIERLRADALRLDWLSSQARIESAGGSTGAWEHLFALPRIKQQGADWPRGPNGPVRLYDFATLRDAIDDRLRLDALRPNDQHERP
jgi:hypothetical protein